MTKRSAQTQQAYEDAQARGETIVSIDEQGNRFLDWTQTDHVQEFEHWVIISNRFPYDTIFNKHDLLLPKRHFAFIREATDDERYEYNRIQKELDRQGVYESIIVNFSNSRSVGKHFHAHLVHWKE